jgi:hypothetical protein
LCWTDRAVASQSLDGCLCFAAAIQADYL